MTDSDFQQELIESGLSLIFLSFGKNGEGEDFYAYLLVRPENITKYRDFLEKKIPNTLEGIETFAEVLHCGLGLPTQEVREHIKEKYGFDEDGAVFFNVVN